MSKSNRRRINNEISAHQVRLIDGSGNQMGIVSIEEALENAKKAGLDLVEIQPKAEPPVVKVMDLGKSDFKNKKQKTRQKRQKVKEIKFRPSTDTNDYAVKLRNLRGFLEGGDKVKVTVWFRGREMAHHELGAKLLERVKVDLEDIGKVEHFPKFEGRQMIMILAPAK